MSLGLTRERVALYVEHLRVLHAPHTVLCHIQELDDALRVMTPEAEWEWLAQVYRALLRPCVRELRPSLDYRLLRGPAASS
jgi:hypothetical protein